MDSWVYHLKRSILKTKINLYWLVTNKNHSVSTKQSNVPLSSLLTNQIHICLNCTFERARAHVMHHRQNIINDREDDGRLTPAQKWIFAHTHARSTFCVTVSSQSRTCSAVCSLATVLNITQLINQAALYLSLCVLYKCLPTCSSQMGSRKFNAWQKNQARNKLTCQACVDRVG